MKELIEDMQLLGSQFDDGLKKLLIRMQELLKEGEVNHGNKLKLTMTLDMENIKRQFNECKKMLRM